MSQPDLNDLYYFAEVVDRGGFAAAGRALGIPKSKLSRRVAELEARLGVRLLQRTTRKLSLTRAGEVYHRHCVALREAAESADEAIASVQQAPRGLIRVACPITLAQSSVGDVVARFLATYPEVRIDMQVGNRVVDLVEEGIDVALRVRPTLEDSGSLVVKQLGRSATLLVAAPDLLERMGRPTAPLDLERLDSVAMGAVDGRSQWRLLGPRGESFRLEHRPRYVADDLLTLRSAVLHGIGIGLLPDYLCRAPMSRGRLVEVLPGWAPPAGLVHAVFPSRRGLVPAVRALLDFLGEHVQGEGLAECDAR